jgi:hypothetical protein
VPISRQALESSGDDLEQLVLDFLRQHSDAAFTIDEILSWLHTQDFSFDNEAVAAALSRLVDRGRIATRVMLGRQWHYYQGRIGFRLT